MIKQPTSQWTRRGFLKTTAATLSAVRFANGAVSWAESPTISRISQKCVAFPMQAVRITGGIFKDAADVNQSYLQTLSVDRLLHTFRLTAGLASNAEPYGGWEDPDCELRGHFAGGHYLSAVAFAYSSSDNTVLKARGDAMVSGLAACQKALGSGYLSAFPEALFEKLSRDEHVWAPFYTLHKILAGLLDMKTQAGNEEALKVAEDLAEWTRRFFSTIGNDQRQRMLRNEYGGMNESLVNLAQLTGKDRYLATARLFEQPSVLDSLAIRKDELQGLHANTTIAKILGAARTYEVTGDRRHQ
jgi:hypothetical protein